MTTLSVPLKRVKRKIKKCQNPLFEKWLKEWKEEAKKSGSEMQYCFNKALISLQKFPFTLNSGKECMILENFGLKICQMLDKKLQDYNGTEIKNNSAKEVRSEKKRKKSSESMLDDQRTREIKSKLVNMEKNTLGYTPSYRSGAYAILIAMFEKSQENTYKGYLTKPEIQKFAQDHCDASFTIPKAGSHYTAWSSMSTLVKKDLVLKIGSPAQFSLTEKGIEVSIKLKAFNHNSFNSKEAQISTNDANNILSNEEASITKDNPEIFQQSNLPLKLHEFNRVPLLVNSPISNQKIFKEIEINDNTSCNSDVPETLFMLPNTFEIILLVDNQERDNKCQKADQMTVRELKSRGIRFEMRHLKVGDFIWIARNNSGQELVLPYTVERKRMDDLASSIKDGRFHEQKFRLKQAKLENLIYLVEKLGNENQRFGLPLPTLMQAILNTQIIGEFIVKVTNSHNHSMKYLACMTTQLNKIFKNKTLMGCKRSHITSINLSDDLVSLVTFADFNKGSEKNKKPTVRNMLIKHLLQLNGLSVEKAKAIVSQYSTPKLLIEALNQPDGEKTIAKLSYGGFSRSIGPVTAQQIKILYTSPTLS